MGRPLPTCLLKNRNMFGGENSEYRNIKRTTFSIVLLHKSEIYTQNKTSWRQKHSSNIWVNIFNHFIFHFLKLKIEKQKERTRKNLVAKTYSKKLYNTLILLYEFILHILLYNVSLRKSWFWFFNLEARGLHWNTFISVRPLNAFIIIT